MVCAFCEIFPRIRDEQTQHISCCHVCNVMLDKTKFATSFHAFKKKYYRKAIKCKNKPQQLGNKRTSANKHKTKYEQGKEQNNQRTTKKQIKQIRVNTGKRTNKQYETNTYAKTQSTNNNRYTNKLKSRLKNTRKEQAQTYSLKSNARCTELDKLTNFSQTAELCRVTERNGLI